MADYDSVLSKSALGLTAFLCAGLPLAAQLPNELSFCPAGIQADGYVDWTKLPPPPASGTVSATLPVAGANGLTVTFQATNPGNPQTPRPFYQVINSTDLRLIFGTNPSILFSKPVRGVSATFQTTGRFGHHFSMTAHTSAGDLTSSQPPDAQVDSASFDFPTQQFSTSQLEIRSNFTNVSAVTFTMAGDEYLDWDLINLRIETGTAPDPSAQVPTAGLREWLRGDRVNGPTAGALNIGTLESWPDQSGRGSDAVPANSSNPPVFLLDGRHCAQVVSFGKNGSTPLNLNLPINGWREMSVFLAAQAYVNAASLSTNQALFWDETHGGGGVTFFSPTQTNVAFQFGTMQPVNQPVYNRPATIGGDFSLTTAMHDGNVDRLWVNGLLALRQGGKLQSISGAVPTATIGAGLNGTPFTGNIGEILIYDRALSNAERETVERYLMAKYGIR